MQNIQRKLYSVKYIQFTRQWAVINAVDGVAQSAWSNRADAALAMRSLNWAAS